MLALLSLAAGFAPARPPACTRTVSTTDSLHAIATASVGGVVCLDPGVHLLGGRSLNITGPPTIWRSSELNNPATITGGTPLTAWQECTAQTCPPDFDGVWTHSMADIDKSMLPVRQLWIAGMRASRRTLAGAALNLSWPHGGFAFNGEAPAWLATAAAVTVTCAR